MQYVLSLLPVLACPVGMGLMMWLMMRRHKEPPTQEIDHAPMSSTREPYQVIESTTPVQGVSEPTRKPAIFSMLFMCLNWKVVGGLAAIAAIIGIIAPHLLLVAIPLLIVVACPLSMLFMMRGMQHGGSQHVQQSASYSEQEGQFRMQGQVDNE